MGTGERILSGTYGWPLVLIIIAQSVLLIVALLLMIAYLLLMDRKVWAAVQHAQGDRTSSARLDLLQSFADLLKFVLKEPVIPAGADKSCVSAGAGRDNGVSRWPPGR